MLRVSYPAHSSQPLIQTATLTTGSVKNVLDDEMGNYISLDSGLNTILLYYDNIRFTRGIARNIGLIDYGEIMGQGEHFTAAFSAMIQRQ